MSENKSPIKLSLLLIEDSDDDALMILREIKQAGFNINYKHVQSPEEMSVALNNQQFDIVISDYNLPKFNGLAALKFLRKMKYDIPFILISGQMGEELAVESMKLGASDYIMKSSLKRLVPAIEREIHDYQKLKSAESEKQKSIELSIEAERKKIEALRLLDEASKMASIGIITSAITHEINQPLNAIKLGSEGILLWNKKNDSVLPEKIISILSKISDASNKIDEIVKHMRQLIINDENIELINVNLNSCIRSATSLLSHQLASMEISLLFETNSDELHIKANHLQLELIINNLIQNAAHSIIQSNNVNKLITVKTYKNNTKIFLEVIDNGIGLPDVPVSQLFDPLFSSRKHIGGTGLGLAIIHRFLTKINAKITAWDNPETGATFEIQFNNYDEGTEN